MKIADIQSIQILDSRGNPTVRTFVILEDGSRHVSSVPSGASTGSKEAHELRDDNLPVYNGKSVLKAVTNVNTTIKSALVGKNANVKEVDEILINLDGTDNKSKLGANAILSVSMAVARAQAYSEKLSLWEFLNKEFFSGTTPSFPHLMVNVINGGVHANWNFDFQEFMVVPNPTTPTDSVKMASEIFHSLGKILKDQGLSALVGDEGGYSPTLSSNEQAFEVILNAAKNAGYENVKDYRLAIDAAASEFFTNETYEFKKENQKMTADALTAYYSEIGQKYKILSFEDPFDEDDLNAHKKFTQMAKEFEFITIGDDLFCTNPKLIEEGIKENLANGALIKLNQIGTVTETCNAINLAKKAHWKVAVSHRSGETEDNFISDLAYSCAADFLKAGSMSRSERLSKYNRLLEIECGL
ncbi:MAG: phosphopyruvate hydratase [Candidatus Levybacteria bacterium]|nr:phosphopyruvate hydratase [Candidatus Levybacteria bacterium]